MGTANPEKLPREGVDSDNVFKCFVIPQSMGAAESTSGDVVITVKTTDNNTYNVVMKEHTANWVEGKQYIYKLTLKKSVIDITATLEDWAIAQQKDIDVEL